MNNYQKLAVETNAPKVVVNSAAAAGKTYIITERIKWLIDNGVPRNKIVVITFTNNAAEEMKQRLGQYSEKVFVNTIHSYVNWLLLCGGVSTKKILDEEKFDELFTEIKKHPYCIQEVEHLLLDEAQDSDELQWEFILNYVKPNNWYAVGDLRQAIYGWKGASPEIMEELMRREDTTTFNLPFNHRNDRNILGFAKRLIEGADSSIAMSEESGQVIEDEYCGEAMVRHIERSLSKGYTYGDWFVLARTNAQVVEMYDELVKAGIPCDTFKKADLSNAEITKKVQENTVKVLTIHSAKGLENNCVMVYGAQHWSEEEKRVAYVAATRAKHILVWFKKKKRKARKKKDVFNWE